MKLKLSALVALGLATSVLPGCSNSVSGTIEDEKVKISDGFYGEVSETVFGVEINYLVVTLTSVPNACETYEAYFDAYSDLELTDDDYSEKAAALYAEYFPEEYWELLLYMGADPDADLDGEVFSGTDWNEFPEEGEASVGFIHNLKLKDEAYYSGDGDLDDYFATYISDGGTMTLNKYVESESISGNFETESSDLSNEGEATGPVTVKYNVDRCAWFESTLDII